MSSIYANSYVTFAATASANAAQGLYRPKDPEHYFRFDMSRDSDQAPYNIYTHRPQDHQPFVSGFLPLMQRAWYYQERILSPRLVSFGDTELYWECRATQCCECGDPGVSSTEVAIVDVKQRLRDTPYTRSRDIRLWQRLVKEYTRLDLTFESDMFPALQGIATVWQRDVTGAYLAGLWDSYLFEGLLWHSHSPQSRPHTYRAPTWSWASLQGSIDYLSPKIDTKDKCATVLAVSTTPAGQDSKGEIVAGHLVLRGRCVPATIGYEGSSEHFHPAGNTITFTSGPGPSRLPGHWYSDVSTNTESGVEILLMEMVDLKNATLRPMYFLGFQKTPNRDSTYERVGLVVTDGLGLRPAFQQWGEEKVITVV
jgi:hypothetical protein